MKTPKPTKAPKCNSKDTETECEAVGCQWNTGNPPADYFEEMESEILVIDNIDNLNKSVLAKGQMIWIVAFLFALLIIGGLVKFCICSKSSRKTVDDNQSIDHYGAIGADESI